MKYRTSSSYNLTFTAASLRPELARVVAETYLATGDWQATKEKSCWHGTTHAEHIWGDYRKNTLPGSNKSA